MIKYDIYEFVWDYEKNWDTDKIMHESAIVIDVAAVIVIISTQLVQKNKPSYTNIVILIWGIGNDMKMFIKHLKICISLYTKMTTDSIYFM